MGPHKSTCKNVQRSLVIPRSLLWSIEWEALVCVPRKQSSQMNMSVESVPYHIPLKCRCPDLFIFYWFRHVYLIYISRFTFQPAFRNWTDSYHSMHCPHDSTTIGGLCRAACLRVSYCFIFKRDIYMVETRINTTDVEVILLVIQREQRGDLKDWRPPEAQKLLNHRHLWRTWDSRGALY